MFVFNTNMMRIIKSNCVKSTPFTIIFLTYKKSLELSMRFSWSFLRSRVADAKEYKPRRFLEA